ncbi:unnamed protein product [Penicillium bialowiezense]
MIYSRVEKPGFGDYGQNTKDQEGYANSVYEVATTYFNAGAIRQARASGADADESDDNALKELKEELKKPLNPLPEDDAALARSHSILADVKATMDEIAHLPHTVLSSDFFRWAPSSAGIQNSQTGFSLQLSRDDSLP